MNPTPRTSKNALTASAAALVLPLLLGACSASTSQPASSAASTSGAAVPSLHHDEGSDLGLEGPTGSPTPVSTPAWNKAEQERAADIAHRAAAAFVDTKVSAQIWRQNLAGFLTQDAQALYSTASNESMPYGAVTKVGAPVQDKAHPMFIDVPVQVEGGALTIKLQYNDDYTKLLVYKIDPA
ncbi:hypothetical protein [Galactobacter valiniphilus]|uniref:hypothetical protein n=1 Tax=Galactobacter valiniphilus TaxID=2676122 RepID=UPI0011C3C8E9|nr:hypothetical protein [Galactobacter valiniphilus]